MLERYFLNEKLDNMDLGIGDVPSRTNRKILIQTKLFYNKKDTFIMRMNLMQPFRQLLVPSQQ